jgi:hypothetical protein
MVTIACPWCAEDVALALTVLAQEPVFTCPCCATSVALVEDADESLELAA